MAALRGFVSVLTDPAADDATRAAAIEFVRANVDQVALTVDLLADGGLLADRPTDTVSRRLNDVLGEAARGRPRVRMLGGPTAGPVVDAVRVRRIVDNLLDNAATHGPSDGEIFLEGRVGGGSAVIAVSDAGTLTPGLAAALVAPEPPPGQRGLGLWIVATLAKQLNGWVTAHERTPCGLAVEVHLPA